MFGAGGPHVLCTSFYDLPVLEYYEKVAFFVERDMRIAESINVLIESIRMPISFGRGKTIPPGP